MQPDHDKDTNHETLTAHSPYVLADTLNGFRIYMGSLMAPLAFSEHSSLYVEVSIPFGEAYGPATWHSATGHNTTAIIHRGYTSIIPSGQPHWGRWERNAEVLVFYFSSQYLEAVSGASNTEMIEGATLSDPFLTHLGDSIYKEFMFKRLLGSEYSASVAYVIAVHLMNHYTTVKTNPAVTPIRPGAGSQVIRHAVDYIHAHLDQPLSVEGIAFIVGLSSGYFRRLFYASFRQSPHLYIINQRVKLAQHLLATTDIRIADIAPKIGFVDAAHFSRVFKQHVGVSPTEYRRQVRI